MAGTPDNARATLARRLTVGILALVAAAQIASSQISTIALLAQKPLFAAGLPFAQARPAALRAWQLAQAGAPRERVVTVANLANRGSPLDEPAFAATALALGADGAGSAWLDHAWRLSRRDPWLLQTMFARARARGDAAGEIAAMAALLQLQLEPGPMRETLLADLARPATFAQALAALREQPRWRHRFFAGLHIDPARVPTVGALIAALREARAPLSAYDMSDLLAPLIYGQGADPAVADAVWRAWLGAADAWAWPVPAANAVHLPFDWAPGDHAHSLDAKPAPVLEFSGKDSAAEPVAIRHFYWPAQRYQFVAVAGPGLANAALSAVLVCDAQTVVLANGAMGQTDHACAHAELRLLAQGATGTVISAALRSLPVK